MIPQVQRWETADKFNSERAKMMSLVYRILSNGHMPMAVVDLSIRRMIFWKDNTVQQLKMGIQVNMVGKEPLMGEFKPDGKAVKMEDA